MDRFDSSTVIQVTSLLFYPFLRLPHGHWSRDRLATSLFKKKFPPHFTILFSTRTNYTCFMPWIFILKTLLPWPEVEEKEGRLLLHQPLPRRERVGSSSVRGYSHHHRIPFYCQDHKVNLRLCMHLPLKQETWTCSRIYTVTWMMDLLKDIYSHLDAHPKDLDDLRAAKTPRSASSAAPLTDQACASSRHRHSRHQLDPVEIPQVPDPHQKNSFYYNCNVIINY